MTVRQETIDTEYFARRDHERQLSRQNWQAQRNRAERIIYFAGAVPLAFLTIAETQSIPAGFCVVALIYSIFSYAFWFINEHYGASWRIADARAEADLISPLAISAEENVQKATQSKNEVETESPQATRTQFIVVTLLICSFASSVFAILDHFIDIECLPSPPLILPVGVAVVSFVVLSIWFFCEFQKIDGDPT